MGSKELYAALQTQYPGYSDRQLGTKVGLAHGTISDLRRGNGIGKKAAQCLAEEDSKWQSLYDEAEKQVFASNSKKNKNPKQVGTQTNLSSLPPHIQQFCGFVG